MDEYVIIIDPIFRASRLIYSCRFAEAANRLNMRSIILTRKHAKTELYQETFQDLPHELEEIVDLPQDFWWGKITKQQLEELIEFSKNISKRRRIIAIFFCGINEYGADFFKAIIERWKGPLKNIPIFGVDYDAQYLLGCRKNLKKYVSLEFKRFAGQFIRKETKYELFWRTISTVKSFKIFILDERIFDPKMAPNDPKLSKRLLFLPDPSPNILIDKHAEQNITGKTTILIVGAQSPRKGFTDIIKVLKDLNFEKTERRFLFVGRLTEETIKFKAFLNKKKAVIEWHEGFFSEKMIQEKFYVSDYVILPYTKEFQGSSGVMAYATEFGKPLITTNHGCIGYRVRKFGLGYVYPAGKADSLFRILGALPNRKSNEYRRLSQNCQLFAEKHKVGCFYDAIKKQLQHV